MSYFRFFLFLILGGIFYAQTPFITINGKSTSLEDFESTYQKNLQMLGADKSIELFTDFELLANYAENEGADQDREFIKPYYLALNSFRDEELVDPKIINAAIEKLYQKLKTEFKVQILFAEKKDKALISKEIQKGSDFTQLIEQYSMSKEYATPSYLKYLEIEDEYLPLLKKLKVGDISQAIPFQENKVFWLKKISERPNLGMFRFQRLANSDKSKVLEIRKKVQNGEEFTPLVLEYSQIPNDDKGVVDDVLTGIPDEVYQSIKGVDVGDYTEVFEYNNTFNLYRVLRHVPLQNMSEKRMVLLPVFKSTQAYFDLYDKNLEKIDSVQTFKIFPNHIEELNRNGKAWFMDSLQYKTHDKPLYQLGGVKLTQGGLLSNLKEAGATEINSDLIELTLGESLYNTKSAYYENVMFFQEPRVQSQIDSIRKANLISYAFDALILKKSYTDEEGMQDYIEQNKERFTFPKRADMHNFYCVNKSTADEVKKLLKKKKSETEIVAHFQNKVDSRGRPFVITEVGNVSHTSEEYPKEVPFKKGVYEVVLENGRVLVSQIKKILPPQLMTVQEAKLTLLEEYQNEYYKKTISHLRENAEININTQQLKKLQNKYPKK